MLLLTQILPAVSEASVTGLFRLVLIVLVVYLVFRVLTMYVLPFLMKRYLQRMQNQFYEQNPHLKDQKQRKAGEVSVDYMPDSNKGTISEDRGEYVDYQEIKD